MSYSRLTGAESLSYKCGKGYELLSKSGEYTYKTTPSLWLFEKLADNSYRYKWEQEGILTMDVDTRSWGVTNIWLFNPKPGQDGIVAESS